MKGKKNSPKELYELVNMQWQKSRGHAYEWLLRVWTLCGGEMQSKQERINMDALSYDLGFYTWKSGENDGPE